jgi:hypothetical protein
MDVMRIHLYCNLVEAPLTHFIGRLVGSVCAGIAASLKIAVPIKHLCYELEGEDVRIQANQAPVPLDMSRGFAKTIVRDTLRGMICHLKGVDLDGLIRIEVDMEK